MESIKDFISEAKKTIKKENIKIANLHRQIDEYETLVYVLGNTGTIEQVNYYKERINKCYAKIDIAIDNIRSCKDRIAVIRTAAKIIKRGEKCA